MHLLYNKLDKGKILIYMNSFQKPSQRWNIVISKNIHTCEKKIRQ